MPQGSSAVRPTNGLYLLPFYIFIDISQLHKTEYKGGVHAERHPSVYGVTFTDNEYVSFNKC